MLIRCSVARSGTSAMACKPGCHQAGLSLAAPTPRFSCYAPVHPLPVQSCPVHGRWPPGGACLVAWLPGFSTFPLGLVRVVFGCSGLLLGLGVVLLCGGPSIPFNRTGLASWGGRDPSLLGQGSRPRSLGQAWSATPSPPVSSCLGPPGPAWLHPVTHVRSPRPLSAHSCFPCHSGFCAVARNSIPAVLGAFQEEARICWCSWGFLASQVFCGFDCELTFVRILLEILQERC